MMLTYHDLDILEARKMSGKNFVHLAQRIDCEVADGDDYREIKLLGFDKTKTGSSTTLRKLLYEIPQSASIFEFEHILASYPAARIIRTISHEPVISLTEREFVRQGLISIETIARRQLIRDSSTVYTDRYGMHVYAQNKLSLTGQFSDQDYRIGSNDAWIQVPTDPFDSAFIYTE